MQNEKMGLPSMTYALGLADPMNSFKLLPCGRIVFYYSKPVPVVTTCNVGLTECSRDGDVPNSDGVPELEKTAVPLGLSDVAISDNFSKSSNRAKRGSLGISSHGRSLIRAGCIWLEERFGKKNLTFLTATLPDEAMRSCSPETWAIVVNRFLKKIRYHLSRKSLCEEIVGCIEIQEARLNSSDGIPPLHLHLLFQGRQNYKHWELGKKFYQQLWKETCQTVWKIEAGFEQSCRVESIKKSGSAYMSKYLSKGGNVISKCNPSLLPSSWHTLSSNLKAIIKNTIIKGNSYLAEQLYEYICSGELLSWSRQIYSVEHGDRTQYLIALVGQIQSRSKYWEIKDALEHLIYRNTEIQSSLYKFEF